MSSTSEESPDPLLDACSQETELQLTRWRAGDDSAFEVLHRRFAPLLRIRVQRSPSWPVLEERLQAEDVVQDIWARAVPAARKAFTSTGSGSFLAFLRTIADRTLVDIVRRQLALKREVNREQELSPGEEPAGFEILMGLRPEETPTSRARVSDLERIARDELTDREFAAWHLVERRGYSAGEAGLALDCSAAAVRGLRKRAREKLHQRLSSR